MYKCKHTEQCGWAWELILHGEDEGFLITDEVTALRGLDSAGNPVEDGDVAHLVALGYFATEAEARPWHKKFAKFITAEVLQRKDDMKTALSVAFAQTWPLLENLAERHVRFRGLARFAKFCWLMWMAANGIDYNGKRVTATLNLARFNEIVDFLDQWYASCLKLEPLPNTQRPRGFIRRLCLQIASRRRPQSPLPSADRRACGGSDGRVLSRRATRSEPAAGQLVTRTGSLRLGITTKF